MGEERSVLNFISCFYTSQNTNYSISSSLSFSLLHNLLRLLKTIGEIMGKVLVNGDGDRAGPTLPAEGEGEEVVGFVLEGPSPVVDICALSKDGNQEGKKGERREREEEGKSGG